VLQCVAVCCSVLQCVAVCCSVLQCVALRCSVLQCAAVCCSVLQCIDACTQNICLLTRYMTFLTERRALLKGYRALLTPPKDGDIAF